MRYLLCIIMLVSLSARCQNDKDPIQATESGIQFVKGLTWGQLLDKAKSTNKFIFVDCYATWCGPCKKMDMEVYPLKKVGDYMNEHFISVKLQMDTSKNDDECVKGQYNQAHQIRQQYKVTAFPTFLFFSPEGKLVHRYLYWLPDTVFLKTAANALNPDRQYCVLLDKYLSGVKDYTKLLYLAIMTKNMGNDTLASQLAEDYIQNYLNKQPETVLNQKKYFEFINIFVTLLTSRDKLFTIMYRDGKRIDDVMGQKDFSKNKVYTVITNEEINPKLWPGNSPISTIPDWSSITKSIHKKYNSYYTDLVVVDAKLKWYQQKKDRGNLIKYTVEKIEKYGIDTIGIGWAIFNNVAYDLFFKHCNNKDTLTKMIHWMELVNKNHPDDQANMDTYANLLYKVGRNEDAITWEEKALQLEMEAAKKENRKPDPGYKETLDKMKKGIPTWVKS